MLQHQHCRVAWAESVWNPVVRHVFCPRQRYLPAEGDEATDAFVLAHTVLDRPFHWAPRGIHVSYECDLFADSVAAAVVESIANLMLSADWHVFMVMTTSGPRLKRMLGGSLLRATRTPHIWWGVEVTHSLTAGDLLHNLRDAAPLVPFALIRPHEGLGRLSLNAMRWVILDTPAGGVMTTTALASVHSAYEEARSAGIPIFLTKGAQQALVACGEDLAGEFERYPAPRPKSAPELSERLRRLGTFLLNHEQRSHESILSHIRC